MVSVRRKEVDVKVYGEEDERLLASDLPPNPPREAYLRPVPDEYVLRIGEDELLCRYPKEMTQDRFEMYCQSIEQVKELMKANVQDWEAPIDRMGLSEKGKQIILGIKDGEDGD